MKEPVVDSKKDDDVKRALYSVINAVIVAIIASIVFAIKPNLNRGLVVYLIYFLTELFGEFLFRKSKNKNKEDSIKK
ncbi:MAG: hypothetical protein GX914_05090 [Erysipelotrichia bacterium]|nr:hypothetical protein [Erysipelotrichia bacterium]